MTAIKVTPDLEKNGDVIENGVSNDTAIDLSDDGDKKGKKGKKVKKGKDEEEKKPEMVPFGQYYRYATKLDVLYIIVAIFFSAIKGFAWPSIMIVFGKMIDDLVGSDKQTVQGSQMALFAYIYIGMGFLNILAGYLSTTLMLLSAERQSSKARNEYFRAIMRQEIGWFDETSSGELTTRLTSDINKLKDGMSDKVSMAVQWITAFLAGFIIAFFYEWRLSLVIMSTSPLLAISGYLFSKFMAEFSEKEQSAYADAGGIAEEVIGAMRTVVSFGAENHESKRYNKKLESSEANGVKNGLFSGISIGMTMLIMFMTYGLAFWYGAKLCGEGKALPGDILIAFFNILIGSFAMGHAAPHFQTMAEGRGAAFTVFKTIDRESKINYENDRGMIPPSCAGKIEFKNVDFCYPSRKDVQIMKGFNLTLETGETHALVGPSGCGKSTAVGLIERFYDADQGEVLLDGVNIKDLNLEWLRNQIGLVGQEPLLFATTIEENIRYGRSDVTQTQIEEACKKAFAHDFIMELPNKYQTLCGDRGSKLSGGQKQRVAIARALVRNPKILLLDEATSALDNKSEDIVQRALDVAAEGRTTLIIAHRLSTIINANTISAIGEYKCIAEEGTHEELLAKEGLYHTLVMYQQQVQNEGGEDLPALPSYEDVQRKASVKRMVSEKSIQQAVSEKEKKLEVVIEDPKSKEKEGPQEMVSFLEIMQENNAYENACIVVGAFGAAANGATMPVFAVLFAEVIQALALVLPDPLDPDKEPDYSKTNEWSLFFVIVGLVAGLANFLQIHFMSLSGLSFTTRMRRKAFKALLRKNMGFFDLPENSIGALTTRLSEDAAAIKGATGVRIGTILQNLVGLGVGIGIAFSASWRLSLLTLACIPFVAAAGSVQMMQLAGTMKTMTRLYEQAGQVAAEAVENMRTVSSLCIERLFLKKYAASLKQPSQKFKKQAHLTGISMGLAEAVIFFTYAAVFTYGNYLMNLPEGHSGKLTFTQLMKVFSGIVFSAMTIGQTMSLLPDYGKAKASAFKLFKLIREPPIIDAYTDKGKKPEVKGLLRFDNVKFDYPSRPDLPVLKGLSFKVDKGKTIALVGQSGCGKSTSVQLSERFYDVLDGNVTIDDIDIREINVAHLRQQMGLVSQEPILFDYSIEENIKYGALFRTVTEDEVRRAAIAANINNFILSLPDGYNTRVGEKGTQLSGGQKQRIAIARALVRNPKILLLDEATSALDNESEKVVQEALDRAREGRTCLVIAHRLSTIQTADLICVIQEGSVVESGTHAELIAMRGVYYNLNKSADKH
ncbi:ATP-dependent translocase ABCB1-like [Bolinopsis microptera]|uniref:ATP-dependent translocase ABCB1-like n=1 Tax=Bolinopsis microptera TaxID=2820187 RepID=UPI00307A97C7